MAKEDINRIVIAEDEIAENLSNILISNVIQDVKTNLRILDFEFDSGSSVNNCRIIVDGNGSEYYFDDLIKAFGLEIKYRNLPIEIARETRDNPNMYEEIFCERVADFLSEGITEFILEERPGYKGEKDSLLQAARPVMINGIEIPPKEIAIPSKETEQ